MVLSKFALFPREQRFFDLFEEGASNLVVGAQALLDLLENYQDVPSKVAYLKELEHQGDEVTHQIFKALNQTFVTPLDREDIAQLAHVVDDVMDFVEAPATRLVLYKISEPTDQARSLARVILRQAEQIHKAMPLLRNKGDMGKILPITVELNSLENVGDQLLHESLAGLFEGVTDVASLTLSIKWREIYELLETATDRAEDVANVLEAVVLKHA